MRRRGRRLAHLKQPLRQHVRELYLLGDILDAPDDAGWYALVHLGAFGSCSGSGVYYRGRLIGVVSAGIAGEYTFVTLIPPAR